MCLHHVCTCLFICVYVYLPNNNFTDCIMHACVHVILCVRVCVCVCVCMCVCVERERGVFVVSVFDSFTCASHSCPFNFIYLSQSMCLFQAFHTLWFVCRLTRKCCVCMGGWVGGLYMCGCTHTHTHTHTHAGMYVSLCGSVCMCTHMHVYACVLVCSLQWILKHLQYEHPL